MIDHKYNIGDVIPTPKNTIATVTGIRIEIMSNVTYVYYKYTRHGISNYSIREDCLRKPTKYQQVLMLCHKHGYFFEKDRGYYNIVDNNAKYGVDQTLFKTLDECISYLTSLEIFPERLKK